MTRALLYLTFIVVASIGTDNNAGFDTDSFDNGHAISVDSDCYDNTAFFQLTDDGCVDHPKFTLQQVTNSYLRSSTLLARHQSTNSLHIRGPPLV